MKACCLSGEEGLSIKQIAEIVDQRVELVTDAIEEMIHEFSQQGRGVQILKIAGVVQLGTLPEHAEYFEKLAYSQHEPLYPKRRWRHWPSWHTGSPLQGLRLRKFAV